METSINKYYMEMFQTLADHNDRNNAPLSNENIQEEIHKVMDEESILDTNNATADTFSHTSNTQRENANVIFTSEKLDKSDELEDRLKDLTINDATCYVSKSATTSDTQGDLTCDTNTVTHTSNVKEKIVDTSNRNFEQQLLSNRTLPLFVPMMNLRIDNRIALIGGVSQTLSTDGTKEVVADTVCGGA